MSDDFNSLIMGGGVKAFPFDNMGDVVEGEIVNMETRQQTEMTADGSKGAPKFFDDGRPMMMGVLTLQTDLRTDDDDDGLRSVYIRGGSFDIAQGKGMSSGAALKDAVKRSGAKNVEIGGRLAIAWTGVAPRKGGFNPAKLYTATYKAPSIGIDIDEMA